MKDTTLSVSLIALMKFKQEPRRHFGFLPIQASQNTPLMNL